MRGGPKPGLAPRPLMIYCALINDLHKQPLTDRVRTTDHSEIAWIVGCLKPLKAAGPDGIQNIILQHLQRIILKLVAEIFNRSLALNCFPTQWKQAKIIMLPKPGKDHTSSLSYRPISLLNSVGKLFEKIVLKRLNFQLRELKVINDNSNKVLKEDPRQHVHC
jgi:hypothetical protein